MAILLTLLLAGGFWQAPIVGPNDAIGFNYTDADFANAQVERFENQYDGGQWLSIGIPTVYQNLNGITTYRVIPTTATGTHTLSFRACNAVGCGNASSPFAFAVLGAPSTAPSNIRVIPRGN